MVGETSNHKRRIIIKCVDLMCRLNVYLILERQGGHGTRHTSCVDLWLAGAGVLRTTLQPGEILKVLLAVFQYTIL